MSLRRSVLFANIFLIVALVAILSVVLNAEDNPPISPAELTMNSELLAPGAPAIILYRQVDRDDTGLSPHENNFVRIKILKEEGRKRADIEIPFFKESGMKIVKLKARTIHADGSVINFEGKPFDKSIVKAKGLQYRQKLSPCLTFRSAASLSTHTLWICRNTSYSIHAGSSMTSSSPDTPRSH